MKEVKPKGLTHDVSKPKDADATHACAVGTESEYRHLAQVKVVVEKCFAEVQNGKIGPKLALKCIKDDVVHILNKY